MTSGPSDSVNRQVLSIFLRIDTASGRIVLRGEFRPVSSGWEIELRAPDADVEPYHATHTFDQCAVIGWVMGLLGRAQTTPAR